MPVYQFTCKECNKNFQVTQTLQEYEKGGVACPKCGSKNVEQTVAAFFAVTSKKS